MLNFNIGNFEIKYREVKYREEGVIIKIEGLNIGVVITLCFKVCVYFFSNFISLVKIKMRFLSWCYLNCFHDKFSIRSIVEAITI